MPGGHPMTVWEPLPTFVRGGRTGCFLFGCGFHVVHLVGLVVFLHLARGQPTDQDTNKNNVSSSMKYWQVNFHVEKNQTLTTKIPYVERC